MITCEIASHLDGLFAGFIGDSGDVAVSQSYI